MKRIIVVAILFVGAALGSTTRASAQEPGVSAKVPFDFVVENRTLPAGTYRIQPHGEFLLVERLDGVGSVYAITNPGEKTTDETPELYFDVVGGKYFLNRVSSSTTRANAVLLPCKMEKKAVELSASRETTQVVHAMAMGR